METIEKTATVSPAATIKPEGKDKAKAKAKAPITCDAFDGSIDLVELIKALNKAKANAGRIESEACKRQIGKPVVSATGDSLMIPLASYAAKYQTAGLFGQDKADIAVNRAQYEAYHQLLNGLVGLGLVKRKARKH